MTPRANALALSLILVVCACESPVSSEELELKDPPSEEVWPALPPILQWADIVAAEHAEYPVNDHLRWLSDGYSPTGQYLNYWHQKWADNESVQFDEEGIPQIKYDGIPYDHPVTLCRYAFHLHGRITRGEGSLAAQFFKVVDRLLSLQDERGAFLYPFAYRLYGHDFAPGWPSGMAQGMAMSVLRRAHHLDPDPRFIQAGDKALEFLRIPREEGGVRTSLADIHPSLSDYLWIEEFATIPANYKLNGFLFTLFGTYDWWQRDPVAATGPPAEARRLFHEGIRTVERTLHYFDLLGYTATDLRYLVRPGTMPRTNGNYHRTHIFQLHSLAEITGSPILKGFERLWRWYVETPQ